MRSLLFFDGSFKGGKASCGFRLESMLGISEGTLPLPSVRQGHTAEYYGLIAGLDKAISLGISELEIVGDSQVIIEQLSGRASVFKNKTLFRAVKERLELIPDYKVRWVPRQENKADGVSRCA